MGCSLLVLSAAALSDAADARSLVHLNRTVWGCVNPSIAAIINNDRDARRADPAWVTQTSEMGECVTITSRSQWEPLTQDQDGFTYLAYRGNIGRPGSFWVPSNAIVFAPPPAAPVDTSMPTLQPVRPEVQQVPLPVPTPAPAPDAGPSWKPQVLADHPAGELLSSVPPSRPAYTSSTTNGQSAIETVPQTAPPSGGSGWVWVILGGIALAVWSRARSASKNKRKNRVEPRSPAATSSVRQREAAPSRASSGVRQTPGSSVREDVSATRGTSFRVSPASLASNRPTATSAPSSRASARPVDSQRSAAPQKEDVAAIRGQSFTIDVSSLSNNGTAAPTKRGRREVKWLPPGTSVTIKGRELLNGMVYLGPAGGHGQNGDCVIDPTLPVSSDPAGPLGYWPSYDRISPACRNRYLDWLALGRRDPEIDVGYVFLFFYGLERRLLLDRPSPAETGLLLAELHRLRGLYADNHSFDGYSARLVEAVEFLREAVDDAYVPDLAGPAGEMPLALQVAIAREVAGKRPLSFRLAAAALIGFRQFSTSSRHVLGQSRETFLQILQSRFERTYPSGLRVEDPADARLRVSYRGAMAGLALDLGERYAAAKLPDPAELDWSDFLRFGSGVAEELTPYAKALTYHPDRAASLAALLACPPELKATLAPQARAWLQSLPALASVPFGLVAGHAIGTTTAKWTIRHRKQVSEALAGVGFAMEPDPDEGPEHLEDNTIVQVFRSADQVRSRGSEVGSVAASLVAGLTSGAAGTDVTTGSDWVERARSTLGLSPSQAVRLNAKIAWMRTKPLNMTKIIRLLGDATQAEKDFCARSAVEAVVAIGSVDKSVVAVLEKLYDRLGVARGSLYSALHSGLGQSSPVDDEPVEVAQAVPEVLHPIPPLPAPGPSAADEERLASIRADTARVDALLAQIFVEEEVEEAVVSETPGSRFDGLNAEHASLVTVLLRQPEWSRDAFEAEARRAGLMPDGAMETINEWAFDHFDDALLEDGDPIAVQVALIRDLAEAAD